MFRIERADAEMPAAVRAKFSCSQGAERFRGEYAGPDLLQKRG